MIVGWTIFLLYVIGVLGSSRYLYTKYADHEHVSGEWSSYCQKSDSDLWCTQNPNIVWISLIPLVWPFTIPGYGLYKLWMITVFAPTKKQRRAARIEEQKIALEQLEQAYTHLTPEDREFLRKATET